MVSVGQRAGAEVRKTWKMAACRMLSICVGPLLVKNGIACQKKVFQVFQLLALQAPLCWAWVGEKWHSLPEKVSQVSQVFQFLEDYQI